METSSMTALTTQFTDAIGDLSAPVLAIMGAGIAITLLIVGFKVLRKVFKGSVN